MSRVNDRVHVDGQRWALVHAFVSDPGRWLPLPAVPMDGSGWLTTVHGGPALQAVQARIGQARDLPDAFIRRISWVPAAHDGALAGRVLPILEGQLRIEHRNPPGVDMVLGAHYPPPGGRAGDLIDAVAMHRIAERTVRRFLEEIAERLRVGASTTA